MLPSLSKIYEACGVLVRKPCAHQLRHRLTLPVGTSAGFSALRLSRPASARIVKPQGYRTTEEKLYTAEKAQASPNRRPASAAGKFCHMKLASQKNQRLG